MLVADCITLSCTIRCTDQMGCEAVCSHRLPHVQRTWATRHGLPHVQRTWATRQLFLYRTDRTVHLAKLLQFLRQLSAPPILRFEGRPEGGQVVAGAGQTFQPSALSVRQSLYCPSV